MTLLDSSGNPIRREPTQEEVDAFDPEQFWLNLLDTQEKLCGAALFANAQREQFQMMAKQGFGSDEIIQVLGAMANDVAQLHMASHDEGEGIDPHGAVIDVASREAELTRAADEFGGQP